MWQSLAIDCMEVIPYCFKGSILFKSVKKRWLNNLSLKLYTADCKVLLEKMTFWRNRLFLFWSECR